MSNHLLLNLLMLNLKHNELTNLTFENQRMIESMINNPEKFCY
jgi:hypothetical protein